MYLWNYCYSYLPERHNVVIPFFNYQLSEEPSYSEEAISEEEYATDSHSDSDSSWQSTESAGSTAQLEKTCREGKQVPGVQAKVQNGSTEDTPVKDRTGAGEDQCIQSSNTSSSVSNKTYCYICGKPVKICTSLKNS